MNVVSISISMCRPFLCKHVFVPVDMYVVSVPVRMYVVSIPVDTYVISYLVNMYVVPANTYVMSILGVSIARNMNVNIYVCSGHVCQSCKIVTFHLVEI
jgi:hypothetical protein